MDQQAFLDADEPLDLSRPEVIRAIRDVFRAAPFETGAICQRLQQTEFHRIRGMELPHVRWLTRELTPLDVLFRVFVMDLAVDTADFERAIQPTPLADWLQVGLVTVEGTEVCRKIQILPVEKLILANDRVPKPPLTQSNKHVMPAGNSSITLASATIRKPVGTALDLGTGGGIQAIVASRHAGHVWATDTNPRALQFLKFNMLFNDVENITVRQGSLFEPVAGLKFDLIVANPPYVISPSSKFQFRDGGRTGDEMVQQVIREAPQHLEEGGYCQFLCEFAVFKGKDHRDRLEAWFADTGCDAWVMVDDMVDVAFHAATWILQGGHASAEEHQREFDEWLAYYQALEIEQIGFAVVTMRKRTTAKRNRLRVDGCPQIRSGGWGRDILQVFESHDFLEALPNDLDLFEQRFVLHPSSLIKQRCEAGQTGWQVTRAQLVREPGLGFNIDLNVAALQGLGLCDGRRTLGEVRDRVAALLRTDTDEIGKQYLELFPLLLLHAFIVPAPDPEITPIADQLSTAVAN